MDTPIQPDNKSMEAVFDLFYHLEAVNSAYCEKCVYGRGKHRAGCPHDPQPVLFVTESGVMLS